MRDAVLPLPGGDDAAKSALDRLFKLVPPARVAWVEARANRTNFLLSRANSICGKLLEWDDHTSIELSEVKASGPAQHPSDEYAPLPVGTRLRGLHWRGETGDVRILIVDR